MILRELRRFLGASTLLSLSGFVVLSLGIGASSLALALLSAFSSLTYPGMKDSGYATVAEETEGGGSERISWNRFDKLRNSPGAGESISLYSQPILTTVEKNQVRRPIAIAAVSSGFFSAFTANVLAGRGFTQGEESSIGERIVILSAPLASALFQSPSNAIGQTVSIGGRSFEVVGVANPAFRGMFGQNQEAWIPAHNVIPMIVDISPDKLPNPDVWKDVNSFYCLVASRELSSEALSKTLTHSLQLRAQGRSALHVSQGITIDPVRDLNVRKWLRLGLIVAVFFTIVSGLNYALLLLSRAPRAVEEVQLKMALGASRCRLLLESMIGPTAMVAAAYMTACLLCVGGLMYISSLSSFYRQLVRGCWGSSLLDMSAELLLAFGVSLVVALIPALESSKEVSIPRMRHTATLGRKAGFMLQIPVVFEISLCTVTWILASMIVSSLLSLLRVPLGYNPSRLSVVQYEMTSESITATIGKRHSFPEVSQLEHVASELAAIPGVASVSYSTGVPFSVPADTLQVQPMDAPQSPLRTISSILVSPSYFATMDINVVQGRRFSPQGSGTQEVVINRALAEELWPGQNAVHRSIRVVHPALSGIDSFTELVEVIGVAEDFRLSGYAHTPEPTAIYSIVGRSFMDVYPRFVVDGTASLQTIQQVATHRSGAFLPGFRVGSVSSVAEQASKALVKDRQRTCFALAGSFTMAFIAYIGLYAALAYTVNTRRREIAVRISLGASAWSIRRILILQAFWSAAAGVLITLPGWPILARLSSSDYLGGASWSIMRASLAGFACLLVSICVAMIPAAAAASTAPSNVLKEL